MSSCHLCQYSLVVRVSVRAGAGLAVLRCANSGVAEEAGGALLAEFTLSVMQAALEGETHHGLDMRLPHLSGLLHSGFMLCTVQMPVSGWQESECPLHSQSSQ